MWRDNLIENMEWGVKTSESRQSGRVEWYMGPVSESGDGTLPPST